MTIAFFRRRRYAMLQKVAAFSLAFVASLAAAEPAPLPSQPAELPVASTTADTRIGSPGNASLQQQPVAMADSTGTDAATEVEILRRFNELRSELLDHRAKTVDWWLTATAIFLTLLGIVAVIAGYLSFERFRKIEAEARENVESSREYAKKARDLVGEIKMKRDEAELLMKGLTAEAVHNDPDEARKVAESVRENPTASPIDQTVADAILLQRQGKIEESMERWYAVAIISEVSDKDLAAQAWFSVGYLTQEYKESALETAMDAYDKAIRLNPSLSEAYNNRGVAKKNIGHHEEAIADYDEAIKLKPDYAEAYGNRGNAKNGLGCHEEAVADYDEAIRLKPDYAAAYNNRGVAKKNIGHHEEAIADYDKAIKLKPDYAEAYNNRGNAKDNLGRCQEALADYDEAIKLKPDNAAAYNNRGVAKKNIGRHEEAISDYDEAIRLEPDSAVVYSNRGKENVSLNRMDEARRDFETTITLARDAGNEALASDAERTLKKLSDEQNPRRNSLQCVTRRRRS